MTEESTRSGYRELVCGFLDLGYEVGLHLFRYWMDSTLVPHRRAALDWRGQRTFVSWLSELYLERHGVAGRVF